MWHVDHATIQRVCLAVVLTALMCGLTLGDSPAAEPNDMAAVGIVPFNGDIPAPDFTLGTPDGHKLRLSDFKGEVVLLNFWATW